ncbi:MAG: AAA family ATPase, partial [Planctomycetes bacterium]|nr:AAA family ATPase [Planctomycetota bacterium]
MRLTGWYIDGYGVFRDYEVRGLRDGLTIFLGPNEAGKSTLLSFVSGVLFGFPQRRGQG